MTNAELIAFLQTLTTVPGLALPSGYAEQLTPFGTTSASLVTVTGASVSIFLPRPCELLVTACFEIATQTGSSATTIAVAVSIDGVDHDEYSRFLSGSNDTGIGAINHRTGVLDRGTHVVNLRCRRVSGVATPGVNRSDMTVIGLSV